MLHAVAIVCFFLSGFAGLVYEICWIRQASLVFGSTSLALSTVLATFFAGLALGAWLFGRIAQRTKRPLLLYAVLEIGLAVLALGSPWAFDIADALYGAAYRELGDELAILAAARVAVVAVLLLPPTILMGGTLPLFCRQFVVSQSSIASSVGLLYAVNTLGAAAGCAATGFVLLPALGVSGAIWVAVGANVAAAAGALALPLTATTRVSDHPQPQAENKHRRDRLVAALFFVTGFVAVGLQVVWARYLTLVMRNTVYTYTVTLTVVLIGIVIGSFIASRLFDGRLPRSLWFGLLQVATGVSVIGLMHLPPEFWWGLDNDLATHALLMLAPAIFSGASFPLAIRMVLDDPGRAGIDVGRMTAVNTVGGIAGALFTGFAGLPLGGIAISLRSLTGASIASGIAAWAFLEPPRKPRRVAAASLGALALWLALPMVAGTDLPRDFLGRNLVVDHQEGNAATLAALRTDGVLRLDIDRWWQGEDRINHQIMAAHVPMLLHPAPRDVLVVGLGTGQAASRFLMYDIDRLDCVDIEPAIFDFVAKLFPSAWMTDDRVRLIRADGRNYLQHTADQYDVISLEVGQLFRPGVATFYTHEFYERARQRLRPGGMLTQFVPLAFLEPEMLQRVIRTFVDVFPHSVLWYNTAELLLIGIRDGEIALREPRIALMSSNEAIASDLRYSQWGGPPFYLDSVENFAGGFLCGPGGLQQLSSGVELLHDDRPELEYVVSEVPETAQLEIGNVDLIRSDLGDPKSLFAGTPTASLDAIAQLRDKNLADITARAHRRRGEQLMRSGETKRAEEELELAVRLNPDDLGCLRALAAAHRRARRFDEAERLYTAVLAVNERDAQAHRALGELLAATDEPARAEEHTRRALELAPNDAIAHNRLGAMLARRGELRAAEQHLERALELLPGYSPAESNLAAVRAAQRP